MDEWRMYDKVRGHLPSTLCPDYFSQNWKIHKLLGSWLLCHLCLVVPVDGCCYLINKIVAGLLPKTVASVILHDWQQFCFLIFEPCFWGLKNSITCLIMLHIQHKCCNCVFFKFFNFPLSMPVWWRRMESGTWHPLILCRGIWASTRSSTTTLKLCSCSPEWRTPQKMGETNIIFSVF